MARYQGHKGDIAFEGTSVGERISFSIELTVNTADASTQGNDWTDTDGLQKSAQGEVECFHDPNDATQTVLEEGAVVAAIFYPAGNTTALKSISGDFLVERVGISTSVGDLVKTTYTIRNKGTVTRATIP